MDGQDGELAPRPVSARVYRSPTIAVYWEPRYCMHAARCVAGLPGVFRPGERPWVKVDAASADEIAEVIARCPSGALHFERLDGGPQERPETPMTLTPRPNGPLYARGRIRITSASGALIREDTRMALCRCGHSANKPFCDGSHRRVGFKAQ